MASRALTARFSNDLLDLAFVGANEAESRLETHHELDVLAQHAPEHLFDLRDLGIEIDHRELQHLAAAHREEPANERGRPLTGLQRLLRALAERMTFGELVEHDFREAGERGEEIVEVVRDPAGETAHRLHLGGVLQLLLEPLPLALRTLPLADVVDEGDRDRSARRVDMAEADFDGELAAVLAAPDEVHPEAHRTRARILEVVPRCRS